MEALNKESEFAAPVLTWSDLREKSTVNVCKELMNHDDVLLKLETKIINNGKGHARACIRSRASRDHGNNAAWFPVLNVI